MFNLGVLAAKAGDDVRARKWREKASENGYNPAMFNLGVLAEKAGDDVQAREWWQKGRRKR